MKNFISKLKVAYSAIKKRIIGENYEDSLFSLTLILCFVFPTFLFVPLNSAVIFPHEHSYSVLGFILISATFYVLHLFRKSYRVAFSLLVSIAFMFVWYFNGGSAGSMSYFYMTLLSCVILILRGAKRLVVGSIILFSILLAIGLEDNKILTPPNPYVSEYAKMIDFQFSAISSMFIVSAIVWGLVKNYDRERVRQVDKILNLTKLSYTDKLTNAYNRRYLEETLPKEITVASELGQDVCGIMIDIDFFKKINDTFGHDRGDEVLSVTAHIIRTSVRRSDLLFRLGGEEFFLFLPNTPKEQCRIVGEKVRKTIEEKFNPTDYKTTISLGACKFNPGETIVDWLKRCDENLYGSKQTGRNKLTLT